MTPASTDVKRKTGDGKAAAAGALSAEESARWTPTGGLQLPISRPDLLARQPAPAEPLKQEHIKPRLLGHWGTSPGLNMLCVHLNRVIKPR